MSGGESLNLAQAVELLGLHTAAGGDRLDSPVTGAIVSDLLSYVMAHGKAGDLWITIQTHPNLIAVAALARLAGILIADGLQPEADAVLRAEEEEIPVFTSPESAYVLAGKLYERGVR